MYLKEVLSYDTEKLLFQLSELHELARFSLAGGTALAIQVGHRKSIDLDFFTSQDFSSNELLELIERKWNVHDVFLDKNSASCWMNTTKERVKVDFIKDAYARIGELVQFEGLRLYPIKDIAAMKLNAITNRGAKKDFYDIYALLEDSPLTNLLELYEAKYDNRNSFAVIKSLSYFTDAEAEPSPILLSDASWTAVKEKIRREISML